MPHIGQKTDLQGKDNTFNADIKSRLNRNTQTENETILEIQLIIH